MGRILDFILLTVVAYFIFKFLNKLFSNPPSRPNNTSNRQNSSRQSTKNSSSRENINWGAETVDYEEIENKKDEKK